MNREERRKLAKQGVKVKSDPVINLKSSDIEAMKIEATKKAADTAFFLSLAIPVMIIHDKFGQLMKKDGREQRFTELCLDLYDSYLKGYVDIEDLHKCLELETGIKVI